MPWVNGPSANGPQECRDDAHKDILLFKLGARGLCAYIMMQSLPMSKHGVSDQRTSWGCRSRLLRTVRCILAPPPSALGSYALVGGSTFLT